MTLIEAVVTTDGKANVLTGHREGPVMGDGGGALATSQQFDFGRGMGGLCLDGCSHSEVLRFRVA